MPKKLIAQKLLCIVVSLFLSGCQSNPYKQFYSSNPNFSVEDVARNRIAPTSSEPVLTRGSNPKADLDNLASDGWVLIGMSSFNGPKANDEQAIQQAKAVSAEQVVVYSQYLRSSQLVVPITTPTTQTSYTNSSATAFGSVGSATARGNSTTTTYGSQTNFVPMTVDKYDSMAFYLVKMRHLFGAQYRYLTNEEARQAGTVNGLVIITIVRGSPAAEAGLLPGDFILNADGSIVADAKGFSEMLRAKQGQSIVLSVVRDGKKIEKSVTLSSQ